MRSDRLLERIRVAYKFLRYGKGMCRIMTCGKCGSVYIKPISKDHVETSHIDAGRHIDQIWSDVCQCMKCGAVCYEIQFWNFEGDPSKIDEGFIIEKDGG